MRHKWSLEELRFLKGNVTGRSFAELTEMFNRRFGTSLSVKYLHGFAKRRGLRNGLPAGFQPGHFVWNKGLPIHASPKSEFKKGHTGYRRKPIGSEKIDKGITFVKTAQPDIWKRKHVLIWEMANGKVPKGHAVIFADRNKANFSLDNLLLVSRGELGTMNFFRYVSPVAELTKVAKTTVDIMMIITDILLKEKQKNKKCNGGKQ